MQLSNESRRHKASHPGNEDQIFEVLKGAARPLSAYDILEALKGTSIKAAVQVYRGLDKLIGQHRVHRIESLNAFVTCTCEVHQSPAAFFICETCGKTVEFDPQPGLGMLQATAAGFHVRRASLELQGLCEDCRDQGMRSV